MLASPFPSLHHAAINGPYFSRWGPFLPDKNVVWGTTTTTTKLMNPPFVYLFQKYNIVRLMSYLIQFKAGPDEMKGYSVNIVGKWFNQC